MHRSFRIIALCLGLLLMPKFMCAQGQLGALTGSIFDPSGAVVPQAEITITNMDSGAKSVVRVPARVYTAFLSPRDDTRWKRSRKASRPPWPPALWCPWPRWSLLT